MDFIRDQALTGGSFFFIAGPRWVESNFVPSKCESRKTEDLGSIRKSLDNASTDTIDFLFQRTVKESPFRKGITVVIRTVGGIGTATLGPFIGTAWHTSSIFYHICLCLFQGRTEDRTQKLREHTISLAVDALFALSHAVLIRDLFFAKQSLIKLSVTLPRHEFQKYWTNKVPVAQRVIHVASTLASMYVCVFTVGGVLHIPYNKSLYLKREFGIVGTNGLPLTFDKTTDLEKLDRKAGTISGHFTELLLKQAKIVLEACQALAKAANVKLDTSCSTPQIFLAMIAARPVDGDLAERQAAQKAIKNYNELREMVIQFSTPKVNLNPFELPEAVCRLHFRSPPTEAELKAKGEEVLEKCAELTKKFLISFDGPPQNPQEFLEILPQLGIPPSELGKAKQSLQEYNALKQEIYGDGASAAEFRAQSLSFSRFFIHGPFNAFISALKNCKNGLNREISGEKHRLLKKVKSRVLATGFALNPSSAYLILGVSEFASLKDCNKAYKDVASSLHPDKNKGDEEATKLFQVVTTAIGFIRSIKPPEESTAAPSNPTPEPLANDLDDLD